MNKTGCTALIHILIGVLFVTTISCSSSRPSTVSHNESISYVIGVPNFSISSNGYYTEDNDIMLRVTTEVIPSSLISVSEDSLKEGESTVGFIANFEVKKENSKESEVIRKSATKELTIKESDRSRNDNFKFSVDFELEDPGNYTISVVITDAKSNKARSVTDYSIVPDPDAENVEISNVKFSARQTDQENYTPVTNYEVTRDFDELLFENQITNGNGQDSIRVDVKVLKFDSDTQPALRLDAPEFMVSTLRRNGIEYSSTEEIFSQQRTFVAVEDVFTYEVGLSTPEVGNYRFSISVRNESTGEEIIRAFDFGVKRAQFPYVNNPRHLAEPLIYLMDEREYYRMMEIKDPDSLKSKVDQFWLRNIKNVDKAQETIELYYNRVEETNKMFSSYKEGWKTDLGLVYILFGPPMFTKTTFNYIQWSYSTDRYSNRDNYFFDEVRRPTRNFPFHVYLLDRSNPELDDNEFLIIQKWLTGNPVN